MPSSCGSRRNSPRRSVEKTGRPPGGKERGPPATPDLLAGCPAFDGFNNPFKNLRCLFYLTYRGGMGLGFLNLGSGVESRKTEGEDLFARGRVAVVCRKGCRVGCGVNLWSGMFVISPTAAGRGDPVAERAFQSRRIAFTKASSSMTLRGRGLTRGGILIGPESRKVGWLKYPVGASCQI